MFSEQLLLCLPLASFFFSFLVPCLPSCEASSVCLPIKHLLPCGITLGGAASLPGFLKLTEDSDCFYMTLSPSVFSKVQASTQKGFKNFSEKWINNAPNPSFSFIIELTLTCWNLIGLLLSSYLPRKCFLFYCIIFLSKLTKMTF